MWRRAAATALVFAVALLSSVHGFLGNDDGMFFPTSVTEDALYKFYHNTGGPTKWPPAYRVNWDTKTPCAWDGNWRKTPSPIGTRCYVGGYHRLPPIGDGGLQFLTHISGYAEGEVPEEFKALQAAGWIIISHNKLHGPIWNTSWLQLCNTFDLSHNRFSGELGGDFMSRNHLHAEVVNLAHNDFGGAVPESVTRLRPLLSLSLEHNGFAGPLPDLSRNEHLRHLSAAHNRLTGPLGWLERSKALSWVELDGNPIAGPLPAALPATVSRFSASGTQLSGPIPAAYGALPLLRHFNCTGCALTCPTPDLLAHLPFSSHCKTAASRAWTIIAN